MHSPSAKTDNSPGARWGLLFLMLTLAVAPLLFGSVTTEAQGVLAILLGASLLLMSGGWKEGLPLFPRWLTFLFWICVLLTVTPLPFQIIKAVSPARADLAARFPLGETVPSWTTFTLSPALSFRWIAQFVLLVAVFSLARQAVRRPDATIWFAGAVIAGVAGQIGAELYFGGAAERTVLGLWPVRWGNSAGTFANRNHYAGWLMMAALLLCSVAIRFYRPLRSSRPSEHERPAPKVWMAWTAGGTAAAAIVFALMSGSRSGLLALLGGGLLLVTGLRRHSSSRRRGFALLLLALALMLLALPFADKTLERLTNTSDETSASYAKWRLWQDAFNTFTQFPLWGTGPGTFVRSNILFKSTGGESTAWHAENDLLQWLSEGGLWGAVVLVAGMVFFWRRVVRWFWSPGWTVKEPELFLGSLAGLVAIMMHSLFDFPWQVMANALLAAALLGSIVGQWDGAVPKTAMRLVSSRRATLLATAAVLLIVAGVFPLLAFREIRIAREPGTPPARAAVHAAKSVALCPVNTERANLWLRLRVTELNSIPKEQLQSEAQAVRMAFTDHLAADPLNWELRLERAWLDIAFEKDPQVALREAEAATALNPKQALIPLRFAVALADRDPVRAWEFLLAADVTQERLLRERLEIGWHLRRDATQLWPLIPGTDGGYRVLAEFALSKKLATLALQAYERMTVAPPATEMASNFLRIDRPDLALMLLPETPGTHQERIVMGKILLGAGDAPASLRLVEPVLLVRSGIADWEEPTALSAPSEALMQAWRDGERSAWLALQVAEVLMTESPERRDIGLLNQLYASYPQEKRLLWLNYRARLDRHEYREAARLAIELAEKLIPK